MSKNNLSENLNPLVSPSLKSWGKAPEEFICNDAVINCGWGRLIFAHSFSSNTDIAKILKEEKKGTRDLAIYSRHPHVVVAKAPQDLFIDPSFTYRLLLSSVPEELAANYYIEPLNKDRDIDEINRIYQVNSMVRVQKSFFKEYYDEGHIIYWVAKENKTDKILGVAMGIDHKKAFSDLENGSSLWALAVDPQATHPGIGIQLVKHVAAYFKKQERKFMDVSVLHTNQEAISLYESMGFEQVPVYCVKNKNAINESLFVSKDPQYEELNSYAMIIINEARRRGIKVNILDAKDNYFKLSYGGRVVACRESLSEMTSAVAMSICANKSATNRFLGLAGLAVPEQTIAAKKHDNLAFLQKHKELVVKPLVGEQGNGITMNVRTSLELEGAIKLASAIEDEVILEQMVHGEDVRILVINYQVVAAAVRQPPHVIGTGKHTILDLVKKQSRRRQKATQGESKIPIDSELERTIAEAGYKLSDVLPMGHNLMVRRAANLHMGAVMKDVTDMLHPSVEDAAVQAAKILNIPVVGFDFIMPDVFAEDYYIIEANERPGLANHDPQPTAERFVDMLFPQSMKAV